MKVTIGVNIIVYCGGGLVQIKHGGEASCGNVLLGGNRGHGRRSFNSMFASILIIKEGCQAHLTIGRV